MDTSHGRDLRKHTGNLIRAAEDGRLSAVAVALAVHLFDDEQISLGKAAQLAGMSRADFTKHLAHLNIPVIRTDAVELARDLAAFDQ